MIFIYYYYCLEGRIEYVEISKMGAGVIGDQIVYSLVVYWEHFTLKEVRNHQKVLNMLET